VPITFAVIPPVIMAVREAYHPQDQWALAMILGTVALWLRRHPYAAGAFVAFAVMSLQYAILAVIVLIIVSNSRDRRRLILGGAITTLVVALTMYDVAGRGALTAIFLGTGDTTIHSGT
jgi:uncharacterized membrane protein